MKHRHYLTLSFLALLMMIAGCEDTVVPTDQLQSQELKHEQGDTIIYSVHLFENNQWYIDTLIVDTIQIVEGYRVVVFYSADAMYVQREWIHDQKLNITNHYGYDGVLGKLPTQRDEFVAEYDDVIDVDPHISIQVHERVTTVTADTTITVPAGTFRCACFLVQGTFDGKEVARRLNWYAPGFGIVQQYSYNFDASTNEFVLEGRRTLLEHNVH